MKSNFSNSERCFRGDDILWHRSRHLNIGACVCNKEEAYACFSDRIEIDNPYSEEEVEEAGGPCPCACHELGEERDWVDVEPGPDPAIDGNVLLRRLGLK